jgi:hypothetical protein
MRSSFDLIVRLAISGNNATEKEKNEIESFYRQSGKDVIYQLVQRKKIIPFVSQLFCNLEIDTDFWSKHVKLYEERNLNIIKTLTDIFADFNKSGVNKIFVYENFGALLSSQSNIALFASGDVDIYADFSHMNSIYSVLKYHGFYSKNKGEMSEKVKTEFFNPSLFQSGFGINVMWTPMSRLKLPFIIDLDYSSPINNLQKYKNTDINLPSNEALLYLCLLHISIHSYSRSPDIRLYIDIVNLCKLDVDWHKILDYSKHDQTEVRVLTACILSMKLLNVEIPDYIIEYQDIYKKQISRLLKLVYDEENNNLLYEPSGINLLIIEALSNNKSLIIGVFNILFPQKNWVRDFYVGDKGSLLVAYLKHIKNLL